MTSQILLENFEALAEAPNAISRLRELILQLAVRGKLLEQELEDEPACALLAEARADFRRRQVSGGLKQQPMEATPLLQPGFDLPASWEVCRVGDVCELRTGATPSRQRRECFGGDVKWLVSGDVHQREIWDCDGRITEIGLAASNCKLLPKNSVLIALNGQGKTRATVALLRTEAACNQSLVAMTPVGSGLVPEYLYWNLRSKYLPIRDITGQKQRRGLNMKLVASLSLELPPRAEQIRIVAKVAELMALCDDLEAKQQRARTVADNLLAAIVHELVNGANRSLE